MLIRLARFNVETSEDDTHEGFEGLPSPAAAGTIAAFAIAMPHLDEYATDPFYAESIQRFAQFLDCRVSLFHPGVSGRVGVLDGFAVPIPARFSAVAVRTSTAAPDWTGTVCRARHLPASLAGATDRLLLLRVRFANSHDDPSVAEKAARGCCILAVRPG